MKQTLTLKLSQRPAMAPELYQAIKLMQLSALELKMEVRQAVESNPMLTLDEDAGEDGFDALERDAHRERDGAETEGAGEDAGEFDSEALAGDEAATTDEPFDAIPEELPVDVSWDEIYPPSTAATTVRVGSDGVAIEERSSAADTLHDYLHWQLNLTRMPERDRLAAVAIIDSIDENGMLRAGSDDLLGAMPPGMHYEVDELQAVLKRVQRFDPPGVGARSVEECLLLQLEQLADDTPWRQQAINLLAHHAALLIKGDPATLARRCKIGADELEQVMLLIQSLSPRPGAAIGGSEIAHIEPDVVVAKKGGHWVVELNREAAPRLRLDDNYAGLVNRVATAADNQYLKDNLHDARWLIKNLQYRNDTLLRVAAEIVKRQRGFLEHGEEAMRPLVMSDVAKAVERHESTISRVATRKYMDTPRGIFELKFFFSSHLAAANGGGEVSSTAIRALIKKLTAEEDQRKPLSDIKIATLLKERNISIARRTVAKYRESLAIPPSNERKRVI